MKAMPVRQRNAPKNPASRRYADFCDDVLKHAPGVSLVEFRHRAGSHGRYAHTPFDYPVTDAERADPQTIIEGVTGVLEGFDYEEGPGLSFEARVKVTVEGELKELGPYRFKLDDEAESNDDPLQSRLDALVRGHEKLEKMLHRAWDRNESILDRAGTLLGPAVELERVKLEHRERMRAYDVEEHEDAQLFDFMKQIGPRWLLTQAAKKEREKGFPDGEKREIWKRLRTVCALIVEREEVRQVMGEKVTDVVEQLGQVQSEEEAAALLEALKRMQADPKVPTPDLFVVVKVAPELLPFADMLMQDESL